MTRIKVRGVPQTPMKIDVPGGIEELELVPAPGTAGSSIVSDGTNWAVGGPAIDESDPPAMFLPIFGDQWVALSQSQIRASNDQIPKYRWDTGLGSGINWIIPAIAPDGSIHYTSSSGGGVMRVIPRGSGPIPRYLVASDSPDLKLCVFAAQAPALGLDPWTLFTGNPVSNMRRWNGIGIRSSTVPSWVTPQTFTGLINCNDACLDSAGRLWCTDGSTAINRYNNIGAAPGALTADVQINGANWPAQRTGLAISAVNDLFISNYVAGAGSIRRLDAAGIAAIVGLGVQNPVPTNTYTVNGFLGIDRIAFDYAGNLWVTAFDTTRVGRIRAADLTTSGVKTCDIVCTGGGAFGDGNNTGPEYIRFFPGFGPLR